MSTPYSYSSSLTSLSDILKRKQDQKDKKESLTIKKGLKEYKPFKPFPSSDPTIIKLSTAESFRQAFERLPGFKPLPTISKLTVGVELPKEYKQGLITNPMTQSFTYSRVEGTAIAEQDNPLMDKVLMNNVRDYCRTHYFGSGTMTGLYSRMRSQLTDKETSVISDEEIAYVRRKFPVSDIPILSGDGATVMSISPMLNMKAAAGAPCFVPGITMEDRIQEIVVRAEEYLVLLKARGASGLYDYFTDESDPKVHEMLAMLCPKMDIYERNEYHTKSRPFGVFPGSLRVLFSCLSTVIKPHLENAFQNPESMSALGISWAHGGARKMFDLILSHTKPGYYPLSWGDDQLIVVVAADGSIILINPDVRGMDMKIDRNKYKLFKAWMLGVFTKRAIKAIEVDKIKEMRKLIEAKDLDNKWLSCIFFFINYMSSTPVLTYKQYIFNKTRGLLSGINLTTWVDNIASGSINYHLEKVPIPQTFNPSTITQYMDSIYKKAEEIGFPFKVEKYSVQVLALKGGVRTFPNRYERGKDTLERVTNKEIITLPFLGQTLAEFTFPGSETDDGKDMTIIVPRSDSVSILAGCALKYPDEKNPEVRNGLLMEGILGRGFNVVTDIRAYLYLKTLWERHVSMGHRPIVSGNLKEVGFEEISQEELKEVGEYPSIYWFAKVFATPKERENLTKVTLVKAERVLQSPFSAKSFASIRMESDDELEELEDMPKLKASHMLKKLELIRDDLEDIEESTVMSSATMHEPKAATKAQNREIQPVPAIRAAHIARYKEKFARIGLLRQRYKALSVKVGRNRGVLIHDEDEDDFGDVDNPEYEEEISTYLEERAQMQAIEEDEEYKAWEREYRRENQEREEYEEEHETEEEYLENIAYDPFSKGEFSGTFAHDSSHVRH